MAKKKKVKIRLLVGFGGEVGGVDSPAAGTELEVPEGLAKALCEEPPEEPRAVYVEDGLKRTATDSKRETRG